MDQILLVCMVLIAAVFALRSIPGFFCSRGYAYQDKGEYAAAEHWFLRAARWEVKIRQLTGSQRGVAVVNTALGLLYHLQNRPTEAAVKLKEAIRIYSKLGRDDDSAPVYASLGKLFYDVGDMDSAEGALNEALAIYSRRSVAGEAMQTVVRLLDLIAERKHGSDKPSTYTNSELAFSFVIPAGWLRQRSVQEFSTSGGQIAVSQETHRATFNVTVGSPGRPGWSEKAVRASAVREYLANAPGRIGSMTTTTSIAVGGESNTVSAEYQTETDIHGFIRRRRDGLISIMHNGLEYVLQWSAEWDLEEQVKGIIDSFRFEA